MLYSFHNCCAYAMDLLDILCVKTSGHGFGVLQSGHIKLRGFLWPAALARDYSFAKNEQYSMGHLSLPSFQLDLNGRKPDIIHLDDADEPDVTAGDLKCFALQVCSHPEEDRHGCSTELQGLILTKTRSIVEEVEIMAY